METGYTGARSADPSAGQRRGTFAQAVLLLLGSCLPVLGAVLVAPLLPLIAAEFAGTPGVEVLTPLVIAAPALLIALVSPFAGAFADRFGRKRLLIAALPLYAVVGVAPVFLDSLPLIVASRFALGATEALIMTCCTALIGDYFHGPQRERMLALQTVAASLGAVLFVIVGGALGEHGWRTPFWLYTIALVFVALAALLLWEPLTASTKVDRAAVPPFPVKSLILLYALTLVGAIGFYVTPAQIAYLLQGVGVTTPSAAGMANGAAQFAILIGAISFTVVRRVGLSSTLVLAFLISGIGLIGLGLATNQQTIIAAAVVNGLGVGLMLPCMLAWTMSLLTLEQRGRGAGGFTTFFFLGQFVSPLLLLAISQQTGGLPGAIVVLGIATLLFTVLAFVARFVVAKPLAD